MSNTQREIEARLYDLLPARHKANLLHDRNACKGAYCRNAVCGIHKSHYLRELSFVERSKSQLGKLEFDSWVDNRH